jgi:hypothetical protein
MQFRKEKLCGSSSEPVYFSFCDAKFKKKIPNLLILAAPQTALADLIFQIRSFDFLA